MNHGTYQSKEPATEPVTASPVQQRQAGNTDLQPKDSRPDAIAQRKLQETISNSTQVKQLQVFQDMADRSRTAQLQSEKTNDTGLPDRLKSGIESLSGKNMDHVKVHYNSDKPALLNAHAYAQGSEIHIAPGQEQHLPHEAWHVVQQAEGRVKPTRQLRSAAINDDDALEKEADVMGAKALNTVQRKAGSPGETTRIHSPVVQRAKKDLNGVTLYTPKKATTTVCIFSHGAINGNDKIDPVAGITLAYFCPHESILNANLGLMAKAPPYSAVDNGKWYNYNLSNVGLNLADEQAQENCDTNGMALAVVTEPMTTAAIVNLLKAEHFTTIRGIHCREVVDGANKQWDAESDQEVRIDKTTVVKRDSVNGKTDYETLNQIDGNTDIQVGFIYMNANYTGAMKVIAVNGSDLTVEPM